jgi:hypothetical protein
MIKGFCLLLPSRRPREKLLVATLFGDLVELSRHTLRGMAYIDIVAQLDDETLTIVFTRKPAGEGMGLGLSLAETYAREASGRLRIENQPGHGTTVSIILPS